MAENDIQDYNKLVHDIFSNDQIEPTLEEQIQEKVKKYQVDASNQKSKYENEINLVQEKLLDKEQNYQKLDQAITEKKKEQRDLQSKIDSKQIQWENFQSELIKQRQYIEILDKIFLERINNQEFLKSLDLQNKSLTDITGLKDIKITAKDIQDVNDQNQILLLELENLQKQYEKLNSQIYQLEFDSQLILLDLQNQMKIENQMRTLVITLNLEDLELNNSDNVTQIIEKYTEDLLYQSQQLRSQQLELDSELKRITNSKQERSEEIRQLSMEIFNLRQRLQATTNNMTYVQHLKDSYNKRINQMTFEIKMDQERLISDRTKMELMRRQRDQLNERSQQEQQIPFSFSTYAVSLMILAFIILQILYGFIL